jgi:hypothetical protein
MPRALEACRSDENDPKRTSARIESRSAAVPHRVPTQGGRQRPIQNNSGRPQGFAGPSASGLTMRVSLSADLDGSGLIANDPDHNQFLDVSYFAQTPGGQRRKLTPHATATR